MKQSILALIEEDIMNFKLIVSFGEMGIEANRYDSNVSPVVRHLLGHEHIDEDKWYDAYFEIVRLGKSSSILENRSEIKELSQKVLEKLNTLQKGQIEEND